MFSWGPTHATQALYHQATPPDLNEPSMQTPLQAFRGLKDSSSRILWVQAHQVQMWIPVLPLTRYFSRILKCSRSWFSHGVIVNIKGDHACTALSWYTYSRFFFLTQWLSLLCRWAQDVNARCRHVLPLWVPLQPQAACIWNIETTKETGPTLLLSRLTAQTHVYELCKCYWILSDVWDGWTNRWMEGQMDESKLTSTTSLLVSLLIQQQDT